MDDSLVTPQIPHFGSGYSTFDSLVAGDRQVCETQVRTVSLPLCFMRYEHGPHHWHLTAVSA